MLIFFLHFFLLVFSLGTLTIRTVLFPLVIKGQRHNARVANNSPQMQVLQQKMTQARQSGNALQSSLQSSLGKISGLSLF